MMVIICRYHKKTWPFDKIKKYELFKRIAIVKSYEEKPKRKEKDFSSAIKKMKEIGLLENTDQAYKEEKNNNGDIISVFKFNKYYIE